MSEAKPIAAEVEKAAKEEPTEKESEEGQSLTELVTFPITVVTLRGDKFQIQVSPVDTVQDVRQYLFESAEACDLTSYTLQLNGTTVNDFVELSKVPNLVSGSVLQMVEAPYNKRSALLHIRRLREILSFHLFNFSNSPSPSLFSYYGLPDDEEEAAEGKTNEGSALQNKHQQPKKGKGKKGGAKADKNAEESAPAVNPLFQLKSDKEESAEIENVTLENFYPTATQSPPACVKSIEFSGWNPPPGNRSLLGDLYYLEVTTLEGKTAHITCWTGGFYVNNSDSFTFDPTPSAKPHRSHHLSGVLGHLSSSFKKNLAQVLKSGQFGKHPFELMAVPIPVTPWIGPPSEQHPYDRNRAEYSILYTEIDFTGNLRDWNEEYQGCKELPKHTVQERIIRDRNLVKVHYDFVDSATKGAMAIVAGTVPPINPVEEPEKHMFVYNNIFFSYAFDTREHGGKSKKEKAAAPAVPILGADGKPIDDKNVDQATYVSANNDLRAIRAFNEADVNGLSTVLTTIIDYRGYRLFAQSLIPGVMQKEETNVLYGSLDKGKTIQNDAKFHELVGEAAKVLHLKEHEVVDGKGESKKIYTVANVKGIMGTDGRRYFVDLVRSTPLDYNYLKPGAEEADDDVYARNEAVLRPELIAMFSEAKDLKVLGDEFFKQKAEKAAEGEKKEGEKKEDEAKEGEEQKPAAEGEQKKAGEAETKKEEEATETETKKEGEAEAKADPFVFNPNALVGSKYFKLGGDKEELTKDEELLKNMAIFLKEALIPRMAEEFLNYVSIPVDGQTLTSIMHRNGVNMRYLGYLAKLCRFRPILTHLCEQEMVTRVAKHEFARLMRNVESHAMAHAISHFLNCLLGDAKPVTSGLDFNALVEEPTAAPKDLPNGTAGDKGKKKKGKKGTAAAASGVSPQQHQQQPKEPKKVAVPKGDVFALSSQALWKTIHALVKERFDYDLSAPVAEEKEGKGKSEAVRKRSRDLATLRSFCLKVGVQVAARNFNFGTSEPFKRADVLDVYPLVKHLNPRSADGQHLLEAGKAFLSQGRLDVAFELFNEALAIFHQVYGPMHPDTAICYGNLAMVHYHANDTAQALVHQKKMVIINERVMGLDHHETAHSYGNLALFGRDLKKPRLLEASLKCIKRAHYLSQLVSGPRHPDSPNTLSHMANMYQDLGRRELALKFNLEALEATQQLFGTEDNLQTASICHQIAMLYNEMDKYREALNYEKRNYNTLSQILGEKDFRTNESNIWLKQFTIKAVKSQIEIKKAQQDITSKISGEKIERLTNIRAGLKSKPVPLKKTFGH